MLPRFTRSWVGPAVSRYTAVGKLHHHSYGSLLCAKLVLNAEDRPQIEQESPAVSGLESEGLQERLTWSSVLRSIRRVHLGRCQLSIGQLQAEAPWSLCVLSQCFSLHTESDSGEVSALGGDLA